MIRTGLFLGLALLVNCGEPLDLGDPATVLRIRAEAVPTESVTLNQDCVGFTASGQPYTGWVAERRRLYYLEDGRIIRTILHSDGVRQHQLSYSWNGNRAVRSVEWPDGQESLVLEELGMPKESECVDGEIR